MSDGVVVIPGHGVFVPEALTPLLFEALRQNKDPGLAGLREMTWQVSIARAARRARSSAPGTTGAFAPASMSAKSSMTVSLAAQTLGVSPRRVRQLLTAGKLTGRQDGQGIWHVDREAVRGRLDAEVSSGARVSAGSGG